MEAAAESLNLSVVIPVRLLRAERKSNMELTNFLYKRKIQTGSCEKTGSGAVGVIQNPYVCVTFLVTVH